ncbi:MAG: metal ABC transporter permease [Salinarimonas sp.]|nr:metal ABC transporter permease [Salinarimonas sp.]
MIAAFFESIPAMILLTGILVGASSALIGVFLVLRGSAMLTDAISHAIVFGIVVVWLLTNQLSGPVQLIGAGLAGLLTVVLSEALARSRLVKMDAAIGLVFPALFAAGVLLISVYARDVHIDTHTVLLGEIGFVWMHTTEIFGIAVPVTVLSLTVILVVNLAFVLLLWKELKIAIFDPALAAALGFAPGVIFYALLGLTSVTAVASFDAVGAILFIAFVITPPATAVLLTRRLARMVVLAVAIAIASCVFGYLFAMRLDVSIGGSMAAMTGVFFALAMLFSPHQGLIAQEFRRRQQKLDHDCVALVVHLHSHEGTPAMAQENTARALTEHLRWRRKRARAVILRALDRELIAREGSLLRLTPKGAAMGVSLVSATARGARARAPQSD